MLMLSTAPLSVRCEIFLRRLVEAVHVYMYVYRYVLLSAGCLGAVLTAGEV